MIVEKLALQTHLSAIKALGQTGYILEGIHLYVDGQTVA